MTETPDPAENLRLQAEEHPLAFTDVFSSLHEFCLHLMHRRAYEEAAALGKGKTVLDLGCNNGYGTKELSRSCRKVVGADVSTKVIEDARRRFGGNGLEFRVFDGTTLPFEDSSFDMLTCFQVIEHIADPAPFLTEISRVLRPGAVALLTTPNAAIRVDPGMKPWNRFHVREFTAENLAELLGSTFERLTLQGMFANEPLYTLLRSRWETQRAASRWRTRTLRIPRTPVEFYGAAVVAAKRLLPPSTITCLRGLLRRGRFDPQASERYSTAHFFYREERLEDALDLMAICRKSREPFD